MDRYDLLVDAQSTFARAFFATKGDGSAAAAFHSISGLTRHDRLPQNPTHLLCAWDAYGGAKHDKQRGPKPPGYHEAKFEVMDRLKAAFGKVNVEQGEADDVVAAAVYRCERQGIRCVVASGDKDLSQLQSETTDFFYLPHKRLLRRDEICAKWGIHRPSHLAVVLALVGDSVDKISGVKGCGPKMAKRIMECISGDMGLGEAYEAVRAALRPKDREEFDRCFSLTCLFDGEEVPEPVKIKNIFDEFDDD